jgi:predicted AlkP superfamily pyrophosphatase or phosphodiesterase
MSTPTEDLLHKLQAHRLPGFDLGAGFVYPDYSGQSILNIPNSICAALGVPAFGTPRLHADIMAPIEGSYQRVVLVLIDALAFHRLRAWMQEPEFAVWKRISEAGILAPLTSVSPSTTCAALTSLWTSAAPAQHGIVGYELWLREYGVVANMILHSPFSFDRQPGSLAHAGFVPREFMNLPTLGVHLAQHDVASHAYQHYSILGSGLSDLFLPQVARHGYLAPSDLWINARQQFGEKANERAFYWVYWDHVDTLSHKYGPDDERVRAEFAAFTNAFERYFLGALRPDERKGTLFLLAADHGQVNTQKDPHYDLRNHPNLTRRLHMQPTGENRLAYLFVKPGQTEAVRETIERAWPNQFTVVDSAYAQDAGLFGKPASPHLADRLGDLVVAARGSAYWWWGSRENPLLGRHGGLGAEEMTVPLLAASLGRL